MEQTRVVVIGGGVAGLVAAHALTRVEHAPQVTVLEASSQLGGQLRTVDFDGALVDVGAEAIHLGAPHVAALVRDLGLDADVIGSAPGTSLLVTRRGPVPLPAGVGPTGPTRLTPVLKSRILTLRGLVRAGLEPLIARTTRSQDDVTVGSFTRSRFGDEVTDTFVDPLLGNLHGGDIDRLSLQATAAQLAPSVRSGKSLVVSNMLARRRRAAHPSGPTAAPLPAFATWPSGLQALTNALADSVRAAGGTIRTESPALAVERGEGVWLVRTNQDVLAADHILFTVPGRVAAELFGPLCPSAADALSKVAMASVATVVLGYRREEVATNTALRDHNGVLVPHQRVQTFKAATNLTRKWPGLGSEHHLVRASVGSIHNRLAEELSDEDLVTRVSAELGDLLGIQARPVISQVVRWPASMPQLELGHLAAMASARADLDRLGGLHLAGCTVDGLGIGSTVRSGQAAARRILDQTTSPTSTEGRL